jgi:nanoRNase/pAp phosphatase (c-di-AMP/oligoRNAs hydrolase)
MVSRLVLGCGSVGFHVVEELAGWNGSVSVVCDDEGRVDTLRGESVRATLADPTDLAVLREHGADAAVVFVAADDPERNLEILTAACEAFPDALLVAYAGRDAPPALLAQLRAGADRVVEPESVVADRFVDAVASQSAMRTQRLRNAIKQVDGTLAVVMHDNPDPDAIASAVALGRLARKMGVQADACYFGDISHQENRAFVNLLDLDLVDLDDDADLSGYGGFALVDHSRPGVNDQLPPDVVPDVVIDHHPPRAPIEARFADLRSDVGATSTLLTNYLSLFDVAWDADIATALLYGIRVDTKDFTREVCSEDFRAAATLLPYVDTAILQKVEEPSIGTETLDILARAITRREVDGSVLATYVGALSDRDALSQAADRLLEMEDIDTTLVYGRKDDTVFVSARSRTAELDLGETLRTAFGRIGSAGGHADMAGAQIPLGLISDLATDDEDLDEAVVAVVTDRFFDTVTARPPGVGADVDVDDGAFVFPFEDGAE